MAQEQSKRQVFDYNIGKNKWAIAALILFILDASAVCLFGVIDSLIVFVIMAVLSVACLLCTTRIKETRKTELLVVMENPSSVALDAVREGLVDGGELYNKKGEKAAQADADAVFAMSSAANHAFVRFPIWARLNDKPYSLPASVIPYAAYLKEERNRELSRFAALRPDKEVVGLASDIDLALMEQEHPEIVVDTLTRYSVQITDDAFDKIIANKKKLHDKIVFDGHSLGLDEDGRLRRFAASELCNEMDIHSLIISRDGYIMFARGSAEHPLRAGKVIASASCSLLPSEIATRPVQESMIDSIHAKIKVLYDIPEKTDIKSSFCGFARMLPRGGAPEFYCLTRLDMDKDDILKAHRDPTSEFVPEMLEDAAAALDTAEDAARYIKDAVEHMRALAGEDISLSASAMLLSIEDAMDDEATSRKVLRRLSVIDHE